MSKRELTEKEKHELLTNRFTAPFKAEVTGKQKKEAEEFWKKLDERKNKDKH